MSSIYETLKYRFWRTPIYSADLLISIGLILLGVILFQYKPYNEPCLFSVARIIDGNQFSFGTVMVVVGLLQLWHVHYGKERRRLAHIVHSISIFLAFAIWLSLAVSSMLGAASIPLSTASFSVLALASLWVFIRYGCPNVR